MYENRRVAYYSYVFLYLGIWVMLIFVNSVINTIIMSEELLLVSNHSNVLLACRNFDFKFI